MCWASYVSDTVQEIVLIWNLKLFFLFCCVNRRKIIFLILKRMSSEESPNVAALCSVCHYGDLNIETGKGAIKVCQRAIERK